MDIRAITSRMTKMLVIGALLFSSVGLLSDTVQTTQPAESPQALGAEPSASKGGANASVILPGQNSPWRTTTESKSQPSSSAAPTPAVSSVEIANDAEPVAAPRSTLEPAKLDVPADQIQSAPVVAPQQAAASPVTSVSKPLPQATTTQKNQKMDRAKAKKLPKPPSLPRIGTHAEDFIAELDTQRLPKRYRRILEKYGLD
jgi:hypothetical protein